jgi:hypothetical protein
MSEMIQVVHKRPALPAEVVEIESTLAAFRALLDGGSLCAVKLTPHIHGYVDDEGLLKELPLNFVLRGEPIVGSVVFSRADAAGDDVGFEAEDALQFCEAINMMGSRFLLGIR